jgi:prophage DNA circulation protein
MALLDDLLPASFREIPFLATNGKVSGGHKQVVHKYPGADYQSIQDLGLDPDVHVITAWIEYDENYINRKNALIRAMKQRGDGILIHPTEGRLTVRPHTYTYTEDYLNELGLAKFELTFRLSIDQPQPQQIPNTIVDQSAAIGIARQRIEAGLAADLEITNTRTETTNTLINSMSDFNSRLASISRTGDTVTSELGAFTGELAEFQSNLNSIVFIPTQLANTTLGLMDQFDLLFDSPSLRLNAFQRLFDIFDDVMFLDIPTASILESRRNIQGARLAFQSNALIKAYENATLIEFNAIEEINSTATLLDNQYRKIIDKLSPSDQLTSAIDQIRAITENLLDERRLNSYQIVETSIAPVTSLVLSYRYYDTIEQADALVELNGIINTGYMGDNVRLFN